MQGIISAAITVACGKAIVKEAIKLFWKEMTGQLNWQKFEINYLFNIKFCELQLKWSHLILYN